MHIMTHLRLAVCGLHLSGQPLNWQLTDLSATFVKACNSAPAYKYGCYNYVERDSKRICLKSAKFKCKARM
jgi:hypothetical protein